MSRLARFPIVRTLSPLAASLSLTFIATPAAWAACSDSNPLSDQTVTCTATAPNPETTAVVSAAGVSGVTLNNDSGSRIAVTSGNAVSLGDGSTVNNSGTLNGGILFRQGSNVLTNSGTVTGSATNVIVFSSGNDTFTMNGGQVTGGID